MREVWRDFLRDVTRDPVRTALTVFGIVLGCASIVFLASALTSAGTALARMNQQASGQDLSRVQGLAAPFKSSKTVKNLSEHDARAIAVAEALPATQIAASTRRMSIEAFVRGVRHRIGIQTGGAEYAALAGMELLHGRFTLPAEDNVRVCMIGYDLWQRMFGGKWPLEEDTMLVQGSVPFKVVGVFKSRPPIGGGGGDGTWMSDRKIYVSNTIFMRSLEQNAEPAEIVFKHPRLSDLSADPPDLSAIAQRLTPLIERIHLGARNFQFDALSKRHQTEDLILLGLGAILFACGIVAMIVGGVNVMNAQLVSIGEKTKEYGVRRALGASARSLQVRVIAQAIMLTGFGGTLGLVLGAGAAYLLSMAMRAMLGEWAFHLVPASIVVAFASALLVGVLAGIVPARRAAQLQPSQCLRDS
jgi:putative ABC transport system permease protein